MSEKELQKRFSKKRDPKSPGHKRVVESKEEKPKTLIQMVKRAWKNGFHTAYFLIDSWYDGLDFIWEIRKIGNGALRHNGVILRIKKSTTSRKFIIYTSPIIFFSGRFGYMRKMCFLCNQNKSLKINRDKI